MLLLIKINPFRNLIPLELPHTLLGVIVNSHD
jgi:hypothetical protein